jgi:site-specific DNA-methyltransferase (cytosine-N4-specific)
MARDAMKSDLPNSSQFSPVQTPLPRLLALVKEHQPSRQAASQAILQEFFPNRAAQTSWDWKLADNTIIAMSQYGLVNKPREDQAHVLLTELGEALADLAARGARQELYDEFVRHILLNRRGLEVVACIQDVIAGGQQPTKAILVKELGRRGIYHPPNGTHLNGMRQWFEAAGLVPKDQWAISEQRLGEILGADSATLDAFSTLSQEQRDFAKAFARLNVDEAWSNEVAEFAAGLFGTEFTRGGLPQSALFALRDVGLIECEKTTTGRGAKVYRVRPTEKLRNEMIEPILNTIEQSASLRCRNALRLSLAGLAANLRVGMSPYVRSAALEGLAVRLAQEFDLWPVDRHVGAEGRIHLSVASYNRRNRIRWQILCKGSRDITQDDVAMEMGFARISRAPLVLLLTTGRLDEEAQKFTHKASNTTGLQFLTVDRSALAKLPAAPSVASLI